nr:hypothetical protein [Clostridium sp. AM45-5]
MNKLFAKRMDELAPSGIRKVNEKALAMERAGETVIHFELGRPDLTLRSTSKRHVSLISKKATYSTPPTLEPWSFVRRSRGS